MVYALSRKVFPPWACFFEWNPREAKRNIAIHGVTFDKASTVFRDPLSCTITDPQHSAGEERYVPTGLSNRNRFLVVVHTERGARIRIISARLATNKERKQYEEIAK
jgi:uncharacterized DUF497 family protein